MEATEHRRKRADELALRFPYSAELMHFYCDVLEVDKSGVARFLEKYPEGGLAAFLRRLLNPPAPVSSGPSTVCPDCGGRLRVHRESEFPHITVEACDSCGTYHKCVDTTLDPAAIPEVDDLASVPLDLWAIGQGYRKLTINLFGL